MQVKDILDKAYFGLMEQGHASMRKNGYCSYLNSDGYKCGVGLFIDDPEVAKMWDSDPNCLHDTSIEGIFCNYEELVPENLMWMKEHLELLTSIQGIHDTASPEEHFREDINSGFKCLYKNHGIPFIKWTPKE